jgi:hypothetical protein
MASRNIGAALAATVLAWVLALSLYSSAGAATGVTPGAGETATGPQAQASAPASAPASAFSELGGSAPGAAFPAVKTASTLKLSESGGRQVENKETKIVERKVNYGDESAIAFTAEVTGGSTEGETVEVKVGTTGTTGTTTCTVHLVAGSGKCTIANAALRASSERYAVSAQYSGDTNLEASSATVSEGLTVTAGRVTAVAAESETKVTYGSESGVTFTAQLTAEGSTPMPAGETAVIRVGSASCDATLSGGATSTGTCTIAPTALAPGAGYAVTAEYPGDENLSASPPSANAVSLTVERIATSFRIKVNSSESPVSVAYGAAATFTETGLAAEAHGTVTFSEGSTPICHFTFPANTSCATSALSAGTYADITAAFAEEAGNYASSTAANTLSLTVQGIPTPFKIKLNGTEAPVTVTYGALTKFEETGLVAQAQGTITITAGQTVLCTFPVPTEDSCSPTLSAGSYSSATGNAISATFLPSPGNYEGSTSPALPLLKVERAPAEFTINVNGSSAAAVRFGSSATLGESGLPSGARGTVTFSSGSTQLCTVTLPASSCVTSSGLSVGSYAGITGSFADTDGNYQSSLSTGTAQLTLEKVATVLSISSTPSPSTPYTPLTLTATVTPSAAAPLAPSGTVTFKSGAHTLGTGTLDALGVATLTTSAPPPGSYYASAVYEGDGDFAGAQSPVIIQAVKETFTGLFTLTASDLHGSPAYRKLATKKRVATDAQLADVDSLLTFAREKAASAVLAATIYDADVTVMEHEGFLTAAQGESLIGLADALPAPKIVAVVSLGHSLTGHAVQVGTIRSGRAVLTLKRLHGPKSSSYQLLIQTRVGSREQTLLSRDLTLTAS